MPKVSTKKAAKKAARQVTKKRGAVRGAGGRFAGRVAPKLTQQAEELLETTGPFAEKDIPTEESEGIKLKLSVDAKDLQQLTEQCDRIADVAGRVEAAAKVVADNSDPLHKQLHRRVLVYVYDASGTRMQSNSFELADGDTLNVSIAKNAISATQSTEAR